MQKLAAMKDKISQLPVEQQAELLDLLSELEDAENKKNAKDDFLSFTKLMWPSFISGRHHKDMANAFERVQRKRGPCRRAHLRDKYRQLTRCTCPPGSQILWDALLTAQM